MKPALRWTLVAAYAAGIFVLSGIPRLNFGGAPQGSDKAAHLVSYCLFCAVIWYALAARMTGVGAAFFAAALASVYGATDEIHQYFVPGRHAGAGDWIADAGGAFIFAAAIAWRQGRRPRVSNRKGDSAAGPQAAATPRRSRPEP